MSMSYGGKTRQFLVHVPSIYAQQNVPVPLLLSLHGMGDNMSNFSQVGFHQISDTANFIVVTPQALTDADPFLSLVGPSWNSGASMFGFSPNSGVDDVGFLIAVADTLSAMYQIDQSRIYCTGFSMGAYMSNRMACQRGDRIAAIATVSGTIGNMVQCNPWGPMPACHFHGTSDQTVSFSGNQSGMDAQELVDYWVANNLCDTPAIYTALPNTANDGFTVDHYYYPNTVNGAEVEFYKVNGADHTWLFKPTNDISYSVEIWKFLRRQTNTATARDAELNSRTVKIWPNPLQNGTLRFEFPPSFQPERATITNATGQVLLNQSVTSTHEIEGLNLPAGIYFLQLQSSEERITARFIQD